MRGLVLSFLMLALSACSTSPAEPTPEAGEPDVVVDAGGVVDAGPAGQDCTFNRDCRDDERCVCDGSCVCAFGERGAGQLGDSCVSGDDCASSVCLEGPGDALMCSAPCDDGFECVDPLPLCSNVAFVGEICVRDPAG